MLKHEVMAADKWHDNGHQDLVTVALCIQLAGDKMQVCLLAVAYACPYHNPTATMQHSVHNVDIRYLLANTTPYTWSALCYVTQLHILEWPFIVPSTRCICVMIMLFNQLLDMPHLSSGWIILA